MDIAFYALPPQVKNIFAISNHIYNLIKLYYYKLMKLNNKLEELSIVIPIYNEAKNIEELWIKIKKKLELKKLEIIFIDDDSKDNTHKILKKIKKKDKKVKFFIRKNKIKDLSKSCILGFNNCKYKHIIVMDGDLQHDPKYIPKLISKYNSSNYDVIVGCRDFFTKKNKGLNFLRTLASLILIFLINMMLGKRTSDPMSGFFLFKKKLFIESKRKFYKKGYKILADIIYNNKDNIHIGDIKINFKKRIYGKSKINIKVLLHLMIFIFDKFKI